SVPADGIAPRLGGAVDQPLPGRRVARRIGRRLLRARGRAGVVGHTGIARRRLQHLQILLRVQHGGEAVRTLAYHVRVGRELRLHPARARALRGNQHHTVGAAAAVNRRGGRVLQDVDGNDVVRVEVPDPAGGGNAVHHDERIVSRGDRAYAANEDAHAVAG